MNPNYRRLLVALAVCLLVGLPLLAQTTASLTGKVTSGGAELPGVTVTISSPNMQGTRTAITNVNGDYNFSAIPPGEYSVRFELESMQPVNRTVRIGVAQTGRADADLSVSAISEAITVTATAPAVLETTEVQTNIQADLVEDLPLARTLIGTTTLAPGVNSNGPNVGAITMSGALAADNLFLVNGAVVNENLRGQPHNLFIEDAIQETTVQTAGISAEYGRFTGGVVNAITKSGGNEFSGSFRDSLQNNDWTEKGPLQTFDNADQINETYEATLGGRIIRDRLWFFGAGRYSDRSTPGQLTNPDAGQVIVPFDAGNEERRLEAKLTGQITPKHSLVFSYLDIKQDQVNNCFIACYEFSNIDLSRSLPNDFKTVHYNGVLTSSFLLEATYAQKNFTFEGSGGDAVGDRVNGSWFYDPNTGAFGGAPVFCGPCGSEERNNETYGLKTTYYLATNSIGTHNLTAGYENWAESRLSNNYQSASNYSVYLSAGSVSRLANGNIQLNVTAGDLIGYHPIDVLSNGSDFQTDSLFVNDKWDLNSKWSFNLGVRYDKNDGKDSFGNVVANDSAFSPRLGAMYDVLGNGRFRINGSYSKYVNRIAETIGGSGSAAGNPATIYYEYQGPDLSGPTFTVFDGVFDWFDSVGGLANTDLIVFVNIPGFNNKIEKQLVSPSVDEFTIGGGWQVNNNAYVRADYIDRKWSDFFVQRSDASTGQVTNAFGQVADLVLFENSDVLERTYKAVQLQGAWRVFPRLNLGGNYTYSETKGNQIGQTSGSGPVSDAILRYPEYKAFAQNNPVGYLAQDQKHKARAWASWDQPLGPAGNLNISVLQNYDSATPFSVFANVLTASRAAEGPVVQFFDVPASRYAQDPTSVGYFFSDRGELRWEDVTSTDLALNYTLPIWQLEFYAQGEVLNTFNEDAQVSGNTTVLTAANSTCIQTTGPKTGQRCSTFNPRTETPIEGIHYRLGPTFGQPTAATTFSTQGSFQLPRTYRLSLGVRF
jgi:outer membrane receptor protein involved in Fe transport